MNRLSLGLVIVALLLGVLGGVYAATALADSNAVPAPQSLVLTAYNRNDYVLNVADAFAADSNLKLAQDRLARLRDPEIAARVEELSINDASQRTRSSMNLVRLALAL